MNKKIKNIMLIILGGIIFTSIGVIGSNVISANQVGINSSKTTKTNIQDAIDELYEQAKTHCPDGMYCTSKVPGYISDGLVVLYDGKTKPKNGRWIDLSGNGNDGILTNFGDTDGWDGSSIYLNGTDYISGANNNPLYTSEGSNSNMTVEVVFKKPTKTYGALISFSQIVNEKIGFMDLWTTEEDYRGYVIEYGYVGNTQYFCRLNYDNYPLNNIIKITYQKDGNVYRTYVGDSKVDEKTINNVVGFTGNQFYIGRPVSNNYYYTGYVYSVRVYNKVLTQNEITKNYNIDKVRFGL